MRSLDSITEILFQAAHFFTLQKRVIVIGLRAMPDSVGETLESRAGRLEKRHPQQCLVGLPGISVVLVPDLPVVITPVGTLQKLFDRFNIDGEVSSVDVVSPIMYNGRL